MKSKNYKLLRNIHLLLALPFGIIISLICFSGAMLALEPDSSGCLDPAGRQPLPMAKIVKAAETMLPDSARITGVTVFADPSIPWQVNLSRPKRASILVDQYSGCAIARSERAPFFATMFSLHRWLLDSSKPADGGIKPGKLIVGISTIIFVATLISGIIIWWPRAAANFRRSLAIPLRGGWRKVWMPLHSALGMYVVVLLLLMSLTGLTWSFGWYRSAVYSICGVEAVKSDKPDRSDKSDKSGKFRRSVDYGVWQSVYARLAAENPDSPKITVSDGKATVALSGSGNPRAADSYSFDSRTGEITKATPYADSPAGGRLHGWLYALHTGSFGGITTRMIWMISALLGASLPLTGYLLYIRRLRIAGRSRL